MKQTVTRFLRILFVLMLPGFAASAQISEMHAFHHVVAMPAGWVKMGTLTLPQGGLNAVFRLYSGSGYSALAFQHAHVEFSIRTSNGAVVNDEGFAFSASATRFGHNPLFAQHIRVVPNLPGVSATAFEIYIYTGNYIGMGFYQVMASPGAIWTHDLGQQQPPPGMNVPFEFITLNDAHLAGAMFVSASTGKVGIGTSTPKAKLAVNGDILATKVKVTQEGWPDYVFEQGYDLMPLATLETYINKHKHLPEMPSAKEVETKGLDLGQTQSNLLQKIEELTLYLIEQDKSLKAQQQVIATQQKALETQQKRIEALEKSNP